MPVKHFQPGALATIVRTKRKQPWRWPREHKVTVTRGLKNATKLFSARDVKTVSRISSAERMSEILQCQRDLAIDADTKIYHISLPVLHPEEGQRTSGQELKGPFKPWLYVGVCMQFQRNSPTSLSTNKFLSCLVGLIFSVSKWTWGLTDDKEVGSSMMWLYRVYAAGLCGDRPHEFTHHSYAPWVAEDSDRTAGTIPPCRGSQLRSWGLEPEPPVPPLLPDSPGAPCLLRRRSKGFSGNEEVVEPANCGKLRAWSGKEKRKRLHCLSALTNWGGVTKSNLGLISTMLFWIWTWITVMPACLMDNWMIAN